MRMILSRVYVKPTVGAASHLVLGQHSLDSVSDNAIGMLGQHSLERNGLQPPRISAVSMVELVPQLLACGADLLGVDHDDEITTLQMRRVGRFVFAYQDGGDLGSDPSECLTAGVDKPPAALNVSSFDRMRPSAHFQPSQSPRIQRFARTRQFSFRTQPLSNRDRGEVTTELR